MHADQSKPPILFNLFVIATKKILVPTIVLMTIRLPSMLSPYRISKPGKRSHSAVFDTLLRIALVSCH